MTVRKFCWITILCGSCSARPPPEAPGNVPEPKEHASIRSPGSAEALLADEKWAEFSVQNHELAIPLPDAQNWAPSSTPGLWFSLVHQRSGSQLRARLWRAARRVRSTDCLETLALWDAHARQGPDAMVAKEPLIGPEGFHGEVKVYVVRTENAALLGSVVAYGASVGQCFGAVFQSTARGVGAETRMAQRLSLVVSKIFAQISVLRVEDRFRPVELQ